jgi:hypothetical protein
LNNYSPSISFIKIHEKFKQSTPQKIGLINFYFYFTKHKFSKPKLARLWLQEDKDSLESQKQTDQKLA